MSARVLIFLLVVLTTSGCSSSTAGRSTGPGHSLRCGGKAETVTEKEALAIAEKALSERHVGSLGRYAMDYDISAEDLGQRWKFRFIGKVRRPGNDHVVFVDKNTSEAEALLGE